MRHEPVNLDKKNLQILQTMFSLQQHEEPFTLEKISILTDIPRKTIERRLSKLKKSGHVQSTRRGKNSWEWDISSLIMTPQKSHGPSFRVIHGGIGASVTPHYDPSNRSMTPHYDPSFSSSNKYNNNTRKKHSNNYYNLDAEGKMNRKKIDPKLEKGITGIMDSSREWKKELQKKKDSCSKTAGRNLRDKMEDKNVKDYNTTDMRFIFEAAWSKNGWKGFPSRWTLKDKKHIREMLNEQGGEILVQYFKYVLENWSSIQRRYKILGGPSISVFYGFRTSWLQEALNNKSQQGATIEYDRSKLTAEDLRF